MPAESADARQRVRAVRSVVSAKLTDASFAAATGAGGAPAADVRAPPLHPAAKVSASSAHARATGRSIRSFMPAIVTATN